MVEEDGPRGDDDIVMFTYEASCNISFRGTQESGYTWGDWNKMSENARADAYVEFIFNDLGVEVFANKGATEDDWE